MKTFRRICFLLPVVALLLTSCVADESDLLVGKWEVISSEIHGADFAPSVGDVFRFYSGGTFRVTEKDGTKSTGTWEYFQDAVSILTLYTGTDGTFASEYEVESINSQEMVLGFDFGFFYGRIVLQKIPGDNSRDK
ncbi:MAG: hypothetical protein J5814_10155 [Bacteroidaceae bacterium]|nr:hypothetical protein [Bacteroidaceae bacterium]MBR5963569.1 hypothetical protein [Bacteroidaceae bacterium]